MTKVILKSANFQKTYSKNVSGRILIDLASSQGKNIRLNKDYNKHIGLISKKLAELAGEKLNLQVKDAYKGAIGGVQELLKTGIKGSPSGDTLTSPGGIKLANPTGSIGIRGWKAFHPEYYKYKGRAYKKTQNRFWVRRAAGGLSAQFGAFAGRHKGAVTNTKVVVVLNTRGKTNIGRGIDKVFRYDLTFTLPQIKHGYLKELLQDSFLLGKPYTGKGYGLPGEFAVLGYLEGEPSKKFSKHRPFIARLMATRGNAMKAKIAKQLKSQVLSTGRLLPP